MPLPTPKKNETQNDFISRFMKSSAAQEFKDQKQRTAVAYEQWRQKEKKK